MENQKVKNGLLFIIALCLVLIALRLFSIDLVQTANAAPPATTSYSYLYGCLPSRDCGNPGNWVPLRATQDGTLYTSR